MPDNARAQALYARFLREGVPQTGVALLVIGSDTCVPTQNSMRNTNYAETVNGVPVRWANFREDEVSYRISEMPGVTYDARGQSSIGGRVYEGYTPTVVLVRDGKLVEMLSIGREFNQRDLERWVAQAQARSADISGSVAPAPAAEPAALAYGERGSAERAV